MVCFSLPSKTDGVDAISSLSRKALQLTSPCQRRLPLFCPLQRYVLPPSPVLQGFHATSQEEFVKRMVQAGHRQAAASRRNTVDYVDMG